MLACSSSPRWPPVWPAACGHTVQGQGFEAAAGTEPGLRRAGVPDDDSFVHVDIDEVRAGAAVGLPVGFWVFVGQFICSMMIRGDLHLLPAFVLL